MMDVYEQRHTQATALASVQQSLLALTDAIQGAHNLSQLQANIDELVEKSLLRRDSAGVSFISSMTEPSSQDARGSGDSVTQISSTQDESKS